MKITFTFTDTPNLHELSKDDIYNTNLEIPDEAQHLIGYEQPVLEIAEAVGNLTYAYLHITCKELGFKNHPVKATSEVQKPSAGGGVYGNFKVLTIYFERYKNRNPEKHQFKILVPVILPFTDKYLLRYGQRDKARKRLLSNLIDLNRLKSSNDEEEKYIEALRTIENQMLILLNSESTLDTRAWVSKGFHPHWTDSGLINRLNNRSKIYAIEERKRKREEEKRKAREAKIALRPVSTTVSPILQTGAGRRPGAIPGIFKGVQFRSQLEIRFATELESRGIQWVYEVERLGQGQYLVDFYLPDYRCWVEVKGRFEPRDHYLLKDVAGYLQCERTERLFVYTGGKCYQIQPSVFLELRREDFWEKLLTVPGEE